MKALDFKFELGSEVKHKLHGYSGIIRGRAQHLTGCNSYGVQGKNLTKDGKPAEWQWFDEDMLILVKKNALKAKAKDRGGPISADRIPKRES